MKRSVLVGTLFAGGVALLSFSISGFAKPTPATTAAPAPPAEPPQVASVQQAIVDIRCAGQGSKCPLSNKPTPVLEGFTWGMTRTKVQDVYNKNGGLFDTEYDAALKRMQPGNGMTAKELERDTKKQAFVDNWSEFKDTPLGYDTHPLLRFEYSYRNHESIQVVEQGGVRRYFFYIVKPGAHEERLWKVFESWPMKMLAESYAAGVTRINAILGAPGLEQPASEKNGRSFLWRDSINQLRVVERGDKHVIVVIEDRGIVAELSRLRVHTTDDPFALDPSVSGATAKPKEPPKDAGAPPHKPKRR